MFTAVLHTIAKIWKQPKCPSTDIENKLVVTRWARERGMGTKGVWKLKGTNYYI